MKGTKRRLELLKQPSSGQDKSASKQNETNEDQNLFNEPEDEDAFLERQKQFKNLVGDTGEDEGIDFNPFVGLSMGGFGYQLTGPNETLDKVTDRRK